MIIKIRIFEQHLLKIALQLDIDRRKKCSYIHGVGKSNANIIWKIDKRCKSIHTIYMENGVNFEFWI
jgi:hypothetical protein